MQNRRLNHSVPFFFESTHRSEVRAKSWCNTRQVLKKMIFVEQTRKEQPYCSITTEVARQRPGPLRWPTNPENQDVAAIRRNANFKRLQPWYSVNVLREVCYKYHRRRNDKGWIKNLLHVTQQFCQCNSFRTNEMVTSIQDVLKEGCRTRRQRPASSQNG